MSARDNPGAPWSQLERRVALAAFAIVSGLIAVFLLSDASAYVNSAQDELLGHLGASAGFTLAATGTMLVIRAARPTLLAMLLSGAAVTVAIELAQGFAPGRAVELRDILVGFSGVLIAAVIIEVVFRSATLLGSLRVHAAGALLATMALLVLLVLDLAPPTVTGAAPDGEACPLTTVTGQGERIIIGDPKISGGCLVTDVGGFGIFGPTDANRLGPDSVLISSRLDVLAASIVESQTVSVRAEFTTGSFDTEGLPSGTVAVLRATELGDLVTVRSRYERFEVYGPSTAPRRASVLSQVLEPNHRYTIEVQLDQNTLIVLIDDQPVGVTTIDGRWLSSLSEAGDDLELTMHIGNNPSRTLPFNGTIEWIEIETPGS